MSSLALACNGTETIDSALWMSGGSNRDWRIRRKDLDEVSSKISAFHTGNFQKPIHPFSSADSKILVDRRHVL